MGFDRGQPVLWRSRPSGGVGTVIAALVVEDSPGVAALFQPAGAPKRERVGTRGGPGGKALLPNGWSGEHRAVQWPGPSTVRVHPVGAAFSVLRGWNPVTDRYEGWYVNLESPWHRTPLGFDSLDHVLDVRVADDLSAWAWKDEDELEWSVEVGKMTREDADAARAEGERVGLLIEGREWPFSAEWSEWAPHPAWGVPGMPPNWKADFR